MKDSDIDWLLEAHTDDELTWRGRLSDNGTKLQFTVDEAIEDYTVEQFSQLGDFENGRFYYENSRLTHCQ